VLCPEHASEMLPYEMEEDETDQSDGEEDAEDEGTPVKTKHVATKRKAKAESSRSAVFSLHTFCHSFLFVCLCLYKCLFLIVSAACLQGLFILY
jgi:hypothetical protein